MVVGGKIPVTILTGFLGSGKTTLLNRLLGDADFADSAVLVNEFGAIGLDHKIIATAKENILLLEAGCLCCVMVDSLRETLADLYQRRAAGEVPFFTRILIETTGLADPAPILQTIMKDGVIAPLFGVAGLACLVDALHGEAQLDEHDEARAQVAMADRIFITKHETGKPSAALRALIAALNSSADIVLVPPLGVSVAPLFAINRLGRAVPPVEPGHHRHAGDIGSQSFLIPEPVSWAGISAWTGHLTERFGDDLLRCKGLLPLTGGGQALVQGVRRLFEIRRADGIAPFEGGGAVICIGRNLDRDVLARGLAWLDAPEGTHFPASSDFAPWAGPQSTENER